MSELITFQKVTKTFQDQIVLQNLNFSVETGEIFVLVGASGSGKTTCLKLMNQLLLPTSGTITFKGTPLKQQNMRLVRFKMGYVLQEIALFPNLTVGENIELIPEMMGVSKEERRKSGEELLAEVGLPKDYYHRFPKELSGGQQQRIGILRGIAANPDVLLMDEPFSALDPISRNDLQDLVLKINQERKTTIVFVTHDMSEAIKIAHRIGVLQDGKLVQMDTPEAILQQPKNEYVRNFFKMANTESTFGSEPLFTFVSDKLLVKENPDFPTLKVTETIEKAIVSLKEAGGVNLLRNQQIIGAITKENLVNLLEAFMKDKSS